METSVWPHRSPPPFSSCLALNTTPAIHPLLLLLRYCPVQTEWNKGEAIAAGVKKISNHSLWLTQPSPHRPVICLNWSRSRCPVIYWVTIEQIPWTAETRSEQTTDGWWRLGPSMFGSFIMANSNNGPSFAVGGLWMGTGAVKEQQRANAEWWGYHRAPSTAIRWKRVHGEK